MKKILSVIIALTMMLTMGALFASAEEINGSVAFPAEGNYEAWYGWSHLQTMGEEFTFTFWVKGKAGTHFSVDNEAGTEYLGYDIKADDTWEKVEVKAAAGSNDDRGTGAPIRIYTNWEHQPFFIDNVTLVKGEETISTEFIAGTVRDDGSTTAGPDTWPWGSWTAGTAKFSADENHVNENAQTADYIGIAAVVAAVALIGTAVIVSKKH